MQKIILFLVLSITQFVFSQNQYDVVFKNVNVVTLQGDQVLLNQNIAVKDGKIVVIEKTKKSKLKGRKRV